MICDCSLLLRRFASQTQPKQIWQYTPDTGSMRDPSTLIARQQNSDGPSRYGEKLIAMSDVFGRNNPFKHEDVRSPSAKVVPEFVEEVRCATSVVLASELKQFTPPLNGRTTLTP
jgi:hypothetical protein